MLHFDNTQTDICEFEPANEGIVRPAIPLYEPCKLPHAIVDDTQLDLAALFLLSYRVRQSARWSTSREELARDFRFGERSFYAAVRTLTDAGYLERTQTKLKGECWYAREILDLSEAPEGPRRGYQRLSRTMGGLGWRQIALLTFLNSWPHKFTVTPKRIANRFNIHIKTVRRLMEPLVKHGLARKSAVSGSSIPGYIRRRRGQNVDTATGQNAGTVAGQNVDAPYKGQVLAVPLDRTLPRASAAACSKSTRAANFPAVHVEEPFFLEEEPRAQGRKKVARQRASDTKRTASKQRAPVTLEDADGENIIERLRRSDLNAILDRRLFSYAGLKTLAAMIDNAVEHHGGEYARRARDAAIECVAAKLCQWNTVSEKEPQSVRSWDYFTDAIREEVEIAIEEMRHAA